MIIGIGTDIIAIQRIDDLLHRQGEAFQHKVFTPAEQAQANRLPQERQAAFYAKRFAAKEAAVKALGTGIGRHARWQDIETLSQENGAPTLHLSGVAAQTLHALAQQYRASSNTSDVRIHLSLADDTFAQAFVIIEII